MMANLNERDRRALRFGGIGLAVMGVLMVFGFPAMDYWDKLNRDLSTAKKQLQAKESTLQDRAAVQMALDSLEKQATIHASAATLNSQPAQLLQQVELMPGYGSLAVRRLEGMPVREAEGFYRSGVTLQFAGRLNDLNEFLKSVESAKPGLRVDRLSLVANQRDPGRVEGQMVLTGYAVVLGKATKG